MTNLSQTKKDKALRYQKTGKDYTHIRNLLKNTITDFTQSFEYK